MSASEWTRLLFIFPLLKPVTSSPHILLPSPNPAILSSLASPSFTTPPPTTPLISTFIETPEQEQCPLSITPPSLVVRYGDPMSANCTIKGLDFNSMGWIVPDLIDPIMGEPMVPFVELAVETMNEWSERPMCFRLTDHSTQCFTQPHVTVYKPPDSVSICYVNHSGPELEAQQYTLQCQVQDVAPVENLTVTFYRGHQALGPPQSSNKDDKKPVNETFSLNVTSSRADDGAVYWCEARLDLGPDGPQPPPVVKSNNLTATVHYKPQTVLGLGSKSFTITAGDHLHLNCSAKGNPSAAYTWTLPPAVSNQNRTSCCLMFDSVKYEDGGEYTCVASNNVGNTTMLFHVTVKVDLLPIIAGLVALGMVVLMVFGGLFYSSHYRRTHTGHYTLKDMLPFRRNNHAFSPAAKEGAAVERENTN